jgi:hypothetical protein
MTGAETPYRPDPQGFIGKPQFGKQREANAKDQVLQAMALTSLLSGPLALGARLPIATARPAQTMPEAAELAFQSQAGKALLPTLGLTAGTGTAGLYALDSITDSLKAKKKQIQDK